MKALKVFWHTDISKDLLFSLMDKTVSVNFLLLNRASACILPHAVIYLGDFSKVYPFGFSVQ